MTCKSACGDMQSYDDWTIEKDCEDAVHYSSGPEGDIIICVCVSLLGLLALAMLALAMIDMLMRWVGVNRLQSSALLCASLALLVYPTLQMCVSYDLFELSFAKTLTPLFLAQLFMLWLPVERSLRFYLVLVNPLALAVFGPPRWWALQPFLVTLCFALWRLRGNGVCGDICRSTTIAVGVGIVIVAFFNMCLPSEYCLLPPSSVFFTRIVAVWGGLIVYSDKAFSWVLAIFGLLWFKVVWEVFGGQQYYPALAISFCYLGFTFLVDDLRNRSRSANAAVEAGGLVLQQTINQQVRQIQSTIALPEDVGEMCTICHENFATNDPVVRYPCHPRHCFHANPCISSLRRHSAQCPICRQRIDVDHNGVALVANTV